MEGHFPPDALALKCDLYNLFPLVIRAKSLLASGILEETDTTESILKKICYGLELECVATRSEIAKLTKLVDADACPVDFLALLAYLVSLPYLGAWSEDRRRVVIKGIAFIWLIKGTNRSWQYLFNIYGYGNVTPWELWKSKIYETFDYSPFEDYTHRFRAARVDLVLNNDPYAPIDYSDALALVEYVDYVRPIHVLVRPYKVAMDAPDDYLFGPCDSSCEVGCETTEETGDAFGIDHEIAGVFQESVPQLADQLALTVTCVSWCQASCETAGCEGTGCQSSCETGCQLFCELGCQLSCEVLCETGCQMTCQVAGCQLDCETTTCELSCELACETGDET